jgi:hypothetical protein
MSTPDEIELRVLQEIGAAQDVQELRHGMLVWLSALDALPEGHARDAMCARLCVAWWERYAALTSTSNT